MDQHSNLSRLMQLSFILLMKILKLMSQMKIIFQAITLTYAPPLLWFHYLPQFALQGWLWKEKSWRVYGSALEMAPFTTIHILLIRTPSHDHI